MISKRRMAVLFLSSVACFLVASAIQLYAADYYLAGAQRELLLDAIDSDQAVDVEALVDIANKDIARDEVYSNVFIKSLAVSWIPWVLVVFLAKISRFRDVVVFVPALLLTWFFFWFNPILYGIALMCGVFGYRKIRSGRLNDDEVQTLGQ